MEEVDSAQAIANAIDKDVLDLWRDAERYRWLRQNPAWETEAFLMGLSPELFDQFVDQAMRVE
jgi:hypothetical protein